MIVQLAAAPFIAVVDLIRIAGGFGVRTAGLARDNFVEGARQRIDEALEDALTINGRN